MTDAADLTIEDGSQVANANTYASVDLLRQYAANRGNTTLPADDAAAAVLLVSAMDYIEARATRYQGTPTSAAAAYCGQTPHPAPQALSWPRQGVYVDGFRVDAASIPARLLAAQCQLALDVAAGAVLMPTVQRDPALGGVKIDKTGPLMTEFFGPSQVFDASYQPLLIAAEALLAPLYQSGGGMALRVGRA